MASAKWRKQALQRPLVITLACLATLARADDPAEAFGSKIPLPVAREARDVSSLSSEYGAPGTPPPYRGQNSFGQNTFGQNSFRPPPPPASFGGGHQGSYRPPPQQGSYRPSSLPQGRPSGSYGVPSNNFGNQYGGGNRHQGGHQEDHSQWVPQPYEFSYAVKDAYTGNDYSHSESGDGSGSVRGEYRVLLPDGRTQIVTYTATDQTGFNAQVTYQGEARPSQGGFGGAGGGGAGGGGGYYSGGTGGGYAGGGQGGYNQGQQHHSTQGFHQGPYRR